MKKILLIVLVLFTLPALGMNKGELVDAIATGSGLSKAEAGKALTVLARISARSLHKRGVAYVPGYGIFLTGRGTASNCFRLAKSDKPVRRSRRCILFYPDENGEQAIVSTFLENYLTDAMNIHAEAQDHSASACTSTNPNADGSLVCPGPIANYERAVILAASAQSMVAAYGSHVPDTFIRAPDQLGDIQINWGKRLEEEMAALKLDSSLATGLVDDMFVSINYRANRAQRLRKAMQTINASNAPQSLIDLLVKKTKLNPDQIDALLKTLATTVHSALARGDEVRLIGFGTFSISKRAARTGRNPQTGKEIKIAAKNVVRFKAGAALSKAVN